MAIPNLAKPQAIMRDLQDRLQIKLPAFYFTRADNSTGAILLVSNVSGTPAAGNQTMAIRIEQEATAFTDVIGNSQTVYAPLKAQVIEESSTISGVSLVTLLNRLNIDLEIARMGLKQQRFMTANGTAPALSMFDSADGNVTGPTLIASLPFDMYWPLSGQ